MRRGVSIAVLLVVFLTDAGRTLCQDSSAAPAPRSESSANPSAAEAKTTEPYVIELLQSKVVFRADGKGYRDLLLRVNIRSESAVREFGLLAYPFAYSL